MKWNLVIFDLDGTLINTIEDLGTAVNHSLRKAGFPEHSMSAYKLKVGHGIRNLVMKALPEHLQDNTEVIDERLKSFLEYYVSHIDVHSKPYEGMHEILRKLSASGTAVAVASNKFQAGTQKLIGSFFPDIPFCAVLGNKPGQALKPDPEVVEICRAAAGITKGSGQARIAIVGDSGTDMKTAANAGITSIGVTWGFRSEEEMREAGADHIVHDSTSLERLLL